MGSSSPDLDCAEGAMNLRTSLADLPDFLIGTSILECLPAKDLLQVAVLNKRFNALASDTGLWTKLVHLDFDAQSDANCLGFGSLKAVNERRHVGHVALAGQESPGEPEEMPHLSGGIVTSNPLFRRQGLQANVSSGRASSRVGNRAFEQLRKTLALKESPEEEHDAKALYFAQLQNFNEFRRMKSKQREARAALMQRRRHRRAIKTMLILCNEKLLVPLMFILLDSSSVLLALWLDSVMVFSVWVALTPLLLLYLALTLSWICFFVLLARRAQSSIFRGMVFEIQAPVFSFAFNVCGHSNLGLCSGFVAFLCFPLFTCLVCSTAEPTALDFVGAWGGIVFLPVWVVFTILLISPLLRWPLFARSTSEYASMLLLAWVPLVGFSVLLCLRLEGILQMPVILMMLPIWMVLTSVHFGLFFAMCFALVKDPETARNAALKLLILVSLEAPFVSFTVLFGLKDANMLDLSYTVVFSPLIATLSFQTLVHVVHLLCNPRVDLPVQRDRPADLNLSLDIWRSQLLQGNLPSRRTRASSMPALVEPARVREEEVNVNIEDASEERVALEDGPVNQT